MTVRSRKIMSRKGQPIVVLVVLLAFWISARLLLWQSPFVDSRDSYAPSLPSYNPPIAITDGLPVFGDVFLPAKSSLHRGRTDTQLGPIMQRSLDAEYFQSARPMRKEHVALTPLPTRAPLPIWREPNPLGGNKVVAQREKIAGSANPESPPSGQSNGDRWSIDAWLFYRPDNQARGSSSAFPATYGASQAGAIVRYRLAADNRHRPALYGRGTAAIGSDREIDVAAGISGRPIPALPVSAYGEVRVSRTQDRTELRPAVFVATEVAPASAPFNSEVSVYGQAGFVGGDFTTPFADGQLRLKRDIARLGSSKLQSGFGVWGGAQKGAARLDIGPTASLDFDVADALVRVAVDYRLRVAGDAQPQSGLAITLSTGF